VLKKLLAKCRSSAGMPFGCVELWAGNERAHRHVALPGLESDVIALPSGGGQGGDLYSLFSCGKDRAARIVLVDCEGHGFNASEMAANVHMTLHKFQDIRDTAQLLGALNDALTPSTTPVGARLRLLTVVTAEFDRVTGEFNYAYAAHPRMLLWRRRENQWAPLGQGLDGLPMGFLTGETYAEQSVRLEPGDLVLAFSDGVTDVFSQKGEQLTAEGFLQLAKATMAGFPSSFSLHDFAEALMAAVRSYHGGDDFEDDLTLLTLRPSS